jgi:hypothetical protein
VDWQDEISEVSMPKTMKQLFCWICLIYDCQLHSLEETAKERSFHFAAPKNLHSPKEHIAAGITLYAHYQHLLKMDAIPAGGDCPCSPKCYRYLKKTSWEELQAKRAALLSPIVKGVIKMGIHVFSYSPCQIWFMLADRRLTCAMVFLFLVEDLNLRALLDQRLQESEAEALLRVGREAEEVEGQLAVRGGRRKVRVAHSELICEITACVHHFLNEGVIDKGCEGCVCRKRQFCLPQCLCDASCPIRKRGCQCRKEDCRTEKCPCFKHNEECDPHLCLSCFSKFKSDCRNHQVMEGGRKKVRVGRSTVGGAGLGLFAGEPIRAGELVMIYSGELIDFSIDLLR